jgi:hypothetical protein
MRPKIQWSRIASAFATIEQYLLSYLNHVVCKYVLLEPSPLRSPPLMFLSQSLVKRQRILLRLASQVSDQNIIPDGWS